MSTCCGASRARWRRCSIIAASPTASSACRLSQPRRSASCTSFIASGATTGSYHAPRQAAGALGISLSLRRARGAQSSSSGLHHRVRYSSLRAVQLPLVLLGPRVHRRSPHLAGAHRGLALPALFGLINQEIGARSKGPRGRTGAIVALACLVLIWGVRDYQHRRARHRHGLVPVSWRRAAARGCLSVHDQSISLARRGGDRRLLRDRSRELAGAGGR